MDEHHSSTMIHACKSGNFAAVVALLERPDVNLNIKDDQSMTALMWAAMLGYRNIITILIKVNNLDKKADSNYASHLNISLG